jgi:glycosyltransferase involved in cell wall biosynthesis
MGRKLRERFHPDLVTDSVHHMTPHFIGRELYYKLVRCSGWEQILDRNQWFQRRVIPQLERIAKTWTGDRPILFTYSYAALDLLRFAKAQGWYTVLGQIDPGWREEVVVQEEHCKHPTLAPQWTPAPAQYWEQWQQECELADQIVVNSPWSSQTLQMGGLSPSKLSMIPLAYEPSQARAGFQRQYPTRFSGDRPLRVLFLGQVILRKGIAAVLDAAERLRQEPIEFWIVGSLGIKPPVNRSPSIRWFGSVPRSATPFYYQQADVFLFPTLSDGFGLTQLEAQAWKLPLITSRFCGAVVKDEVNGWILPEVTGEAIAQRLRHCLYHPHELEGRSQHAIDLAEFSLAQLYQRLQALPYAPV